jgi:adenylosuccinate lyase
MAHGLIAISSTRKGLSKLTLNSDRIAADLDRHWAVVAEAIQTILRREAFPKPYEALKALTRGQGGINEESIAAFIAGLDVSEPVRAELQAITPHNYIGYSAE